MPVPTIVAPTTPPIALVTSVVNGTIWPELFKWGGWMAGVAIVIALIRRVTAK